MQFRNALSGVALGSLAGLVAQGYYAGHRVLPSFQNLDPSTVVGPETAPPVRIVALGDSTLTGPGLVDASEIWVRQMVDQIRLPVRVELTSVGMGGAKATDVRRYQLPPALALDADLALVSVGSNDAIRGVPPRLFRSDLVVTVNALTGAGAIVVLLGVGDLSTIPRLPAPLAHLLNLRAAAFDRIQTRLAATHPDVLKVPMRELATPPFRTQSGMFSPDLFHPSARGHAAWADAATPTVARVVRHLAERSKTCDG